MVHSIYLYGEEILRKKAEDVDLNDPMLPIIIEDMFATVRMARGAGLAAPQIGVSKRIVVVEDEIADGVLFKGVFLNPKIISYGGHLIKMTEGCLSFPELKIDINRHTFIDIEWYDENKKYNREMLSGIQAIILQHEIDHLNGILFIDKLNADDRLKIFMLLENIKNKNVASTYPII